MAADRPIGRRGFLVATFASAGMALWQPIAAAVAEERFLSSRGAGHRAQAVVFDLEQGVRIVQTIPARGHGMARRPGRLEVALVGRRPGFFLAVLDSVDGAVQRWLTPPDGRWFNGHAAYSADGGVLFTSESGVEGDWIGRWAAAEGYARLPDWSCHGIEPHEIILSPDGQWLVIANGGLRYGSDGAVLGQPGAGSALVWLDSRTGALARRLTLPVDAADLSLRHLAMMPDGTALVGLQAYGNRAGSRPLAALGHRQSGLKLLALESLPALNYVGSVAISGQYVALSCPRGNFVALLDPWRERIVQRIDIVDGCGLAPVAGGIVATSGQGGAVVGDSAGVRDRLPAAQLPGAWDNHLLALG